MGNDNSDHLVPRQKGTYVGILSNVLEFYDFAVYGYLSDILSVVFFPASTASLQLIESLLVFAAGYLMKPIGGAFAGWLGDKYGRKFALERITIIMAIPTYLMGCLPSYSMVGNTAWILLLLLRLGQGFSVGGQLMTSLTFALESIPHEKWGLYTTFTGMAGSVGMLLGSLVSAILRSALSSDDLIEWGWRLPFYAGISNALLGFYLRYSCVDDVTHEASNNPLAAMVARNNLRRLLALFQVALPLCAVINLITVWMAVFMADLVEPPIEDAYWITTGAVAVTTFTTTPFFGWLSDKLGRVPVMVTGLILFAATAPTVLNVISACNGDAYVAFFANLAMGAAYSMFAGPAFTWMVELFPPSVRLISLTVVYNISSIFGGFSPALATYLATSYGTTVPGYYCFALSVVALVALSNAPPPARIKKEEEENTIDKK